MRFSITLIEFCCLVTRVWEYGKSSAKFKFLDRGDLRKEKWRAKQFRTGFLALQKPLPETKFFSFNRMNEAQFFLFYTILSQESRLLSIFATAINCYGPSETVHYKEIRLHVLMYIRYHILYYYYYHC